MHHPLCVHICFDAICVIRTQWLRKKTKKKKKKKDLYKYGQDRTENKMKVIGGLAVRSKVVSMVSALISSRHL